MINFLKEMKHLRKFWGYGLLLHIHCLTALKTSIQPELPVVETIYGKIQGTILKAKQDSLFNYTAFMGIPYAAPPLKKLRFTPPLKPVPWNTTKPCQVYGTPCLQISKKNGSVLGNEDCLTLNVFTRGIETTNLKPVMFWIHGGAHIRGSSSEFGPDYLVEKPIVLVTVNYRLNIFGFLSTNAENVFGNTGLKDQVAALEWVQDNIVRFGGDPRKVTIFGESSGSDSVTLLQLSSRTKGLFHQIIAQSGSALNSRYLQSNPLKYVYNIAHYFNVSTSSNCEIIKGLQKIDAVELTKAANSSKATGYSTDLKAMAFFPIIEIENEGAIISQSPFELMNVGDYNKVPYMIGYNTNEGTVGINIVNFEMDIEDFDENYALFAPDSLNNEEKKNFTGALVREHFLGNSSAKDANKFNRFLGQELLVRGVRKGIDFQRKSLPGYFYRFSYKGTDTTKYEGVAHGEELQYLFVKDGFTNVSKSDILTRKRMVEMWTNFAIFGSPIIKDTLLSKNVSWEKCDEDSLNFLDIGENLIPGTFPDETDYIFWNKLFATYGVPPYQTF